MRGWLTNRWRKKQAKAHQIKTPANSPPLEVKRRVAAVWTALFVLGAVILASAHTQHKELLMPGPLTAAHSLQTKCRTCHTNVPKGHFGWLQTIVSFADPGKESKACLACHKIGGETLSPHNLDIEELAKRTKRVEKSTVTRGPPIALRVSDLLLPTAGSTDDGVFCATCHKEHQGANFELARMSDNRCQSCHAVQFKSFARGHPDFGSYPYKRRTRVVFDHSTHFGKHFPDGLKKRETAQAVPKVCTDCHSTKADKRLMSVKPFKAVCSSCHLDQIVGTERATGPKGIAFVTLPGLDTETLKEKGVKVGSWPEDSEAELTPFMRMLMGLDEQRRNTLRAVAELDLLDLSSASDAELKAVGAFVWELKALLHELSSSKSSVIAERIAKATGARVDRDLTAKLVATIPRDVLLSAQREWLPKLDAEIALRPKEKRAGWDASVSAPSSVTGEASGAGHSDAARQTPNPVSSGVPAGEQDPEPNTQAAPGRSAPGQAFQPNARSNLLPFGEAAVLHARQRKDNAVRQVQGAQRGREVSEPGPDSWRIDPYGRLIKGRKGAEALEEAEGEESDVSDEEAEQSADPVEEDVVDQYDDDGAGGESEEDSDNGPVRRASSANAGGVDSESWAELGGWYRSDYSILYRPTGHTDAFLRAWLEFSGRLRDDAPGNLAAAVFGLLTHKDAQGQCIKCHSVDQGNGQSRVIEWGTSPLSAKARRLTSFMHEPHFGLLGKRGCLTCHEIHTEAKYQETYKQHNPVQFVSNFKPMQKEQCIACHKKNAARQDCMLCHSYHVDDVTSPVARTRFPTNKQPEE